MITSGRGRWKGFRCGPFIGALNSGISIDQNLPSMRNEPSRVQIASMMSIASSIISLLLAPTPKYCPSVGNEPGAKPAM